MHKVIVGLFVFTVGVAGGCAVLESRPSDGRPATLERPADIPDVAGGPTEALFAYGTLLDPHIQRRVIGRVVDIEPDVLVGYRRDRIRLGSGTYAIAVRASGREIVGGVLDVTASELKKIDRYEGDAYERARVVLKSGLQAWVYREHEDDAAT